MRRTWTCNPNLVGRFGSSLSWFTVHVLAYPLGARIALQATTMNVHNMINVS